jgi:prepilin-type N-terminal cleavage/methylation domain-containing protein
MFFKSKNKGFTLIELLVVISIISLLSSIVIGSMRDAREKAEYAELYNDLRQLEIAFQLMYSDYNGWPDERDTINEQIDGNPLNWSAPVSSIISDGLVTLNQYISKAPNFPISTYSNFYYSYDADAAWNKYAFSEEGCELNENGIGDGTSLWIHYGAGSNIDDVIFEKLNNLYDPGESFDSDPDQARRCGKIRKAENTIIYSLDNAKAIRI